MERVISELCSLYNVIVNPTQVNLAISKFKGMEEILRVISKM